MAETEQTIQTNQPEGGQKPATGHRIKSKKLLIILAALVVLAALAAVYWFFIREKPPVEIRQETRASLEEGQCSDAELADIEESISSQNDAGARALKYEDLASCYNFREDDNGVKDAYSRAAEEWDKAGDSTRAEESRGVVESMEQIEQLQQGDGEEEEEEPLAF